MITPLPRSILAMYALCVALACITQCRACSSARADAWTADEVAVARLCASEASLASRTDDCRAIAGIVARHSARAGITPAQYVATRHTRHTRAGHPRAWIAELSGDMSRPPSWPEQAVPWAARVDDWAWTLGQAREGLTAPRRCHAVTWGGPVVDDHRIARMTSAGWRIVDCGRTANVFLSRKAGGR